MNYKMTANHQIRWRNEYVYDFRKSTQAIILCYVFVSVTNVTFLGRLKLKIINDIHKYVDTF